MKDSGGSTPSTYVTPKPRRKPCKTDFTNRRARKRRASRKKVDLKGDNLSAPVKRRGEGLPVALKFCSIRKLILDSIVEVKEEFVEDTVVENREQDQDVLLSGIAREEMTDELEFDCSQREESPQPSIRFNDSSGIGPHSQSGPYSNSDEVRLHQPS
jgi:hypothetical protein